MSKLPRIIFAGTPEFAVSPLQGLLNHGYPVVAVYTQPDRPAGRGQKLLPSPVKTLALKYQLHVEQPENFKTTATQITLATFAADLMLVAAYGLLLPPTILSIPRWGSFNIHASLLPRWRGAAPIQRAILAGDTETGVSIMQMVTKLDAGPIIHQLHTPILPEDTSALLHDRLAALGTQAMLEILPLIATNQITPKPQDPTLASYAPKITKPEAILNWQQPAAQLANQVRAFNPWPVTQTYWNGIALRIWEAQAIPGAGQPGAIVAVTAHGLEVGTGDGLLRITKLQLPNKRAIRAIDFSNAHDLKGAIWH